MKIKGFVPDLRTIQTVVELCAEQGHSRLALELISSYEQGSVRRIEPGVWMTCLTAAAADLWVGNAFHCSFDLRSEFQSARRRYSLLEHAY
jgi:hypothetical protein